MSDGRMVRVQYDLARESHESTPMGALVAHALRQKDGGVLMAKGFYRLVTRVGDLAATIRHTGRRPKQTSG